MRGVVAEAQVGQVTARAAHDGYRHLRGRPVHRRQWSLVTEGLQVDDDITGSGVHTVAVRWHLPPGSELCLESHGATVSTATGHFAVTVTGSAPVRLEMEAGSVAVGFQRTTSAPVLACRMDAILPARLSATWRRRELPNTRRPA